jgi:RND family efflux transporter MFP subunit
MVFAAVVVLLLGLGTIAYFSRSRRPVVMIAVAIKPEVGQGMTLLNASGYVTPRRRATIAAKITGRVAGVYFDEGTAVHNGQLLANLDDSDARRALDSARADRDASQAAIAEFAVALRNSELELYRARELHKAAIVSQESFDNATAQDESLKAKLDLARRQLAASEARIGVAQQALDNCTIRAPFDGIVVSKDAQVGEIVSPVSAGGGFTRTGIATIVDMKSNEIEVDVNESYIARVTPGQGVRATLDAYPDRELQARVRTVIPTADRQKATVKVRITFDRMESFILPDMGVKVAFLEDHLPAGNTKKRNPEDPSQTLTYIPKSAVRDGSNSPFVLLVSNGKVERHAVKVGIDRGTDVAILAGVHPGDSFVVRGPKDLRDGENVEVRP